MDEGQVPDLSKSSASQVKAMIDKQAPKAPAAVVETKKVYQLPDKQIVAATVKETMKTSGPRKTMPKPQAGVMKNVKIDMTPDEVKPEPFRRAIKVEKVAPEVEQAQDKTTISYAAKDTELLATIDPKNPPASLYATLKNKPLASEYFGLQQFYGEFDTEKKSAAVESFVLDQMKRNHLADTKDGYFQYLSEIESMLNLGENHDIFYRLDKVAKYIDIVGKEREVEKRKRRLLGS